jgi:hypothetical protein
MESMDRKEQGTRSPGVNTGEECRLAFGAAHQVAFGSLAPI